MSNIRGLTRFTRRDFLRAAIASSGVAAMGGIGLLTAPAAGVAPWTYRTEFSADRVGDCWKSRGYSRKK
jgi:hypothetical protein